MAVAENSSGLLQPGRSQAENVMEALGLLQMQHQGSWLTLRPHLQSQPGKGSVSSTPIGQRRHRTGSPPLPAAPQPCSREGAVETTAWLLTSSLGRSPRSWERTWPESQLQV